ncbi:MAG: alanine racemase [Oscillospiraceae bacterium]|nr:alanine racemase [Oscillospiraceae bacterium]
MNLLKRTWAEINLDHLAHNVEYLRKGLPEGCRFLGVVKADAYGHGAVPIARELEKLGAGYLAVSNFEEALQLRRADVALPILILGYTPPAYAAREAALNITQEVHSLEYGRELSKALEGTGRTLKIHMKVDTGMSRLGFFAYGRPETIPELMELDSLANLRTEGIFMHFAVSDTPSEDAYTLMQHRRFMGILEGLAEQGIHPEIVHCANSGATIAYPQFAHDMVRPGIATYGLDPSGDLRGMADLRPLMELKTSIAAIRPFEPGITVSYGRTYETKEKRTIAVCTIGYADGLPRRLSGKACFLLHGKKVPVVGRICMDMCMVDITGVPEAKVGDTVTVVGREGDLSITWDDWADELGTISYELVCDINKRVPRVYLKNGEVADCLQYIV